MHEIKEECRRQEEQAAEFNVQWQDRVDALMEKLNKYFALGCTLKELVMMRMGLQLEVEVSRNWGWHHGSTACGPHH